MNTRLEQALEAYKTACEPALAAVNARLQRYGVPDWDLYEAETAPYRAVYEAAVLAAAEAGEDVEGY